LAGSGQPTAINSNGEVVGYSWDRGLHAVYWPEPDQIINLGLPGEDSYATDINDYGQIAVNTSWIDEFGHGQWRIYLWSLEEGRVDLGSLGGSVRMAYAVNNLGHVVGGSMTSLDEPGHPFFWSPTTGMMDLGTFGCDFTPSYAHDMNDRDEIVGISCGRAFYWSASTGMIDIGGFSNDGYASANAINNVGQIVGVSRTARGDVHAFLWTLSGGMRDLGTLSGIGESRAYDINNLGQIVGESTNLPEPETGLCLIASFLLLGMHHSRSPRFR
jgi:probable HAF family extracellular repeat protein